MTANLNILRINKVKKGASKPTPKPILARPVARVPHVKEPREKNPHPKVSASTASAHKNCRDGGMESLSNLYSERACERIRQAVDAIKKEKNWTYDAIAQCINQAEGRNVLTKDLIYRLVNYGYFQKQRTFAKTNTILLKLPYLAIASNVFTKEDLIAIALDRDPITYKARRALGIDKTRLLHAEKIPAMELLQSAIVKMTRSELVEAINEITRQMAQIARAAEGEVSKSPAVEETSAASSPSITTEENPSEADNVTRSNLNCDSDPLQDSRENLLVNLKARGYDLDRVTSTTTEENPSEADNVTRPNLDCDSDPLQALRENLLIELKARGYNLDRVTMAQPLQQFLIGELELSPGQMRQYILPYKLFLKGRNSLPAELARALAHWVAISRSDRNDYRAQGNADHSNEQDNSGFGDMPLSLG
jgi:hypothetical protein